MYYKSNKFNRVWLNKDNSTELKNAMKLTEPNKNCTYNSIDCVLTPTVNTILRNPLGSIKMLSKKCTIIDKRWNVIYFDYISENIIKYYKINNK
jgi:hypothetical protein